MSLPAVVLKPCWFHLWGFSQIQLLHPWCSATPPIPLPSILTHGRGLSTSFLEDPCIKIIFHIQAVFLKHRCEHYTFSFSLGMWYLYSFFPSYTEHSNSLCWMNRCQYSSSHCLKFTFLIFPIASNWSTIPFYLMPHSSVISCQPKANTAAYPHT